MDTGSRFRNTALEYTSQNMVILCRRKYSLPRW